MKLFFTIGLLLITAQLFSQDRLTDFTAVDDKARFIDSDDPAVLAQELTEFCHNDKEKVRSIFRWITDHITYYKATPKKAKRRTADAMYEDDADDTAALKPVTERIAIKVLKDRRTHCEGYARLFKSLCDHAGIPAQIITGYARTDVFRMESQFKTNHSWNAVYFDSAWHLLDATWASGFTTTFSGDFVKYYNEYYFLPDPADFARHHYPDDLRWTLLDHPPALEEFRKTPFHQRSFVKYGITDFYPSRGTIEASLGDTVTIELETMTGLVRPIAPDSIWDAETLFITPMAAYVKPGSSLLNKKVVYKFPVDSDKVEWLHIMYNDDAVLQYKLAIKDKKSIAGN